jgi:hypothetical protein
MWLGWIILGLIGDWLLLVVLWRLYARWRKAR